MHSLPTELLLLIAAAVIDDAGPGFATWTLKTLSSVCREWRETLLSTPQLWSRVSICVFGYGRIAHTEPILPVILSRSYPHPLDLTITEGLRDVAALRAKGETIAFNGQLSEIRGRQIHHLHLRFEKTEGKLRHQYIWDWFGQDAFQDMTSLHLEGGLHGIHQDSRFQITVDNITVHSPALEDLRLFGVFLTQFASCPFLNLVALDLHWSPHHYDGRCWLRLGQLQKLEELCLRFPDGEIPLPRTDGLEPVSYPDMTLARLRELTIECAKLPSSQLAASYFRSLDLPSLQSLHLFCPEKSHAHWKEVVLRPGRTYPHVKSLRIYSDAPRDEYGPRFPALDEIIVPPLIRWTREEGHFGVDVSWALGPSWPRRRIIDLREHTERQPVVLASVKGQVSSIGRSHAEPKLVILVHPSAKAWCEDKGIWDWLIENTDVITDRGGVHRVRTFFA
ncbi:hypothetical protein PUNSTDRAFT_138814 [Punctularia strigosozonata HHB-11173 SS5]|uniref:Uncharacterized protein n=1 Tax=Punctularia strigosozonata (strain HHB-11173) TaxID=741275 RepID=R7S2K4_PUNST|nr:uncharacterized protein PUNSTDRAFT_138814 [Punctularia strigosozonata HHB-11173 SS5]EIN04084.1 hypothetical protein PUNSTDRAFT_138814 [Punctularia strigosozonata HHB-11173 SS5]